MSTITISATQLKNETSEILNQVIFNGAVAIVSKYGKPLVKIMRVEDDQTTLPDFSGILDRYYGCATDFPEVNQNRPFREKDLVIEE